jgi:deoxyadenosine/deoxycytidine kinase
MNRPVIISIEGNIGAGKTTAIEYLEKHMYFNMKEKDNSILFLREPVNVWDTIKDASGETILEKFYKDSDKYAFAFQVMAYATRTANVKNAIKNNPECKIIICERSLEADNNVFAKMLRDDGKIENIQYQIYEHFFHAGKDDLKTDAIIYVDSCPAVCHARINKRSREGEGGISLEYLQSCRDYHDKWLIDDPSIPVLRIDTNEDVSYDHKDPCDKGKVWLETMEDFIRGHPMCSE